MDVVKHGYVWIWNDTNSIHIPACPECNHKPLNCVLCGYKSGDLYTLRAEFECSICGCKCSVERKDE